MNKWVVHNKRSNFDVYIGRATREYKASKWANPFKMEKEEDRSKVIEQYRLWLHNQLELMLDLPELKGKHLGCWCAPKACHGDILSLYVNGSPNHRRILIAGSRDYLNIAEFKEQVERYLPKDKTPIIITGMARGVDTLAYNYAKANRLDYMPLRANWDVHGKSAGYKRNLVMAELADEAIIFWNTTSKGTKHMLDICKRKKIPTTLILI